MKKIMIIIAITLVIVLISVILVLLSPKFTLRGYFDDWVPESSETIVDVKNRDIVYYSSEKEVWLDQLFDGIYVEETFCVEKERIYFCYSTSVSNSKSERVWHIGSVKEDETDFKEHYTSNHINVKSDLGDYQSLSQGYDRETSIGGLYYNHKIYLKEPDRMIVYDITTDMVQETERLPEAKYQWTIDNNHTIVFTELSSGAMQTVTLESLAEKNTYAARLLEMKDSKIAIGDSAIRDFFSKVKVIDDNIYLICEVFNWHGFTFAVVFRYDFSNDQALYVHSVKVGDPVSSRYSFVLEYSE